MKNNLLIAVLAIGMVALSGCVQSQSETGTLVPHFAHPSNINTFFYNLHLEVKVSSFVFQ